MNIIKANIWTYWPEHWIVIPTNIGWKKNGENVMGRGLAAQAAARFPGLAKHYGQTCLAFGSTTTTFPATKEHIILFPVKPLAAEPSASWRQRASLELIERSTIQLRRWATGELGTDPIAMPMVGCGNGGLKREEVLPILERHLGDLSNLVLVDQT